MDGGIVEETDALIRELSLPPRSSDPGSSGGGGSSKRAPHIEIMKSFSLHPESSTARDPALGRLTPRAGVGPGQERRAKPA